MKDKNKKKTRKSGMKISDFFVLCNHILFYVVFFGFILTRMGITGRIEKTISKNFGTPSRQVHSESGEDFWQSFLKRSKAEEVGHFIRGFATEYLRGNKENIRAKAETAKTGENNKEEPSEIPAIQNKTEEPAVEVAEIPENSKEEIFEIIFPVQGKITSPFGERIHPIDGKKSFHKGIDIGAKSGDIVLASHEGEVIRSEFNEYSGNLIVTDCKGGYTISYAHLSSRSAEVGDKVQTGDVIGFVGSTGIATGPHLHFEVRKDGEPVDPLLFVGE